jgi:hypothetical protein
MFRIIGNYGLSRLVTMTGPKGRERGGGVAAPPARPREGPGQNLKAFHVNQL